MTIQKSFGDFTSERFGPNWVYGHSKAKECFARNGERQTVITKKEQQQLVADYKAAWGREYDPEMWGMICALRAIAGHSAESAVLATSALKAAGVAL